MTLVVIAGIFQYSQQKKIGGVMVIPSIYKGTVGLAWILFIFAITFQLVVLNTLEME